VALLASRSKPRRLKDCSAKPPDGEAGRPRNGADDAKRKLPRRVVGAGPRARHLGDELGELVPLGW